MQPIDVILKLMNDKHISAAQLTREAGITNGLITQWKKGLQKPSAKNLQKIADYFNVTTDYLLTGEETKKSSPPADNTEEDDEIDFNDIRFALSGEVHDLTDAEKRDIINFAKFIRAQRKSKEDSDKKEG
jgi:Predicted transcriptional regulators